MRGGKGEARASDGVGGRRLKVGGSDTRSFAWGFGGGGGQAVGGLLMRGAMTGGETDVGVEGGYLFLAERERWWVIRRYERGSTDPEIFQL